MNLISTAITGTPDYHSFMQQVTVHGLRTAAGYTPVRGVFSQNGTPHKQGELIPLTATNEDKFDVRHIDALAAFCKGYGWIAGSAALWRYLCSAEGEPRWYPDDIDVFCHTENVYDQIRDTLRVSDIMSENERSVKTSDFGYIVGNKRYRMDIPINFVRPLPSDNWQYPANVLGGFDLTCCTVAIIQPGVVYILDGSDVRDKKIDYTGETISPIATMRRLFKYINRGYQPHYLLWRKMANDERMLPVMTVFNELWLSGDEKHVLNVVKQIYRVVPDDVSYSSGSSEDD